MRIVLVEPSRIGRQILTELLERRSYDVKSFSDGLEAFRYIQRDPDVGVVLTSFELPGMTGLELCWETRLLIQEKRQIYVIVMSSSLETDKAIQALDSGADDFIRKPPVAEELFAKLRAAQRLANMHKQLLGMANHDVLTGLLNRRAFLDAAQSVLDDALSDIPISVIMLDIDHFKSINDNFGHHAGDLALRETAKYLKVDKGIVGRLGGEEFAIILPIACDLEAARFAEHIRLKIEKIVLEVDGSTIKWTSSFGISQWHNTEIDTVSDLIKRADRALYRAKREGRNRVVIAEPDIQFQEIEFV